jgi:hypothetical protein
MDLVFVKPEFELYKNYTTKLPHHTTNVGLAKQMYENKIKNNRIINHCTSCQGIPFLVEEWKLLNHAQSSCSLALFDVQLPCIAFLFYVLAEIERLYYPLLCMKLLWHSSWVSQPCSSLVHKHHQLYRI